MKNICLLGATGSIGQSTLDIIKANPNEYCLTAFSFNQNIDKACVAKLRAATLITQGSNSPAILYIFGIINNNP